MKTSIRQQQSEKTYNRFINAIADIIASGDIEAFTIRSLCSSLGLSPRTFYLYFENKEQAILKCYSYYEQQLQDEIIKRQKQSESLYERVLQIFEAKIEVSLAAAHLGRMLYICALNYYDESIYSDNLPLYKAVKAALDDCVDKNAYKFNADTRTLAWELIDFSRGIVFDYFLRQESYDLRKVSATRMKRYFDTFIETTITS